MSDINTSSILLESLLELERKAVGIKFIFEKEEYDEFKASTMDNMMAYCTMVRNASQGKSYKVCLKNFACLGAAMALGLLKPNNGTISGKRRSENGSYKDLCISRSLSRDMVYCQHDIYGVAIMPLEQYKENPDVVIIITDPYNAMRIIQGNAYHSGQAKGIKIAGMQALCQECTSFPFETNEINISMMCSGTRLLAQWNRDELAIGIPFNKFATILDGIKQTVNPLERNPQKKIIQKKLKENNLEDALNIEYNKNYDDGAYIGIKGLDNYK